MLPGLHDYFVLDLRKPLIVALTKADLVPVEALRAWSSDLQSRFPYLKGRVVAANSLSQSQGAAEPLLSLIRKACEVSTEAKGGEAAESETELIRTTAGERSCPAPLFVAFVGVYASLPELRPPSKGIPTARERPGSASESLDLCLDLCG